MGGILSLSRCLSCEQQVFQMLCHWSNTEIVQVCKCHFRIEGRSDDLTMLSLVETHCVPILTYGIEIAHFFDSRQKSKIRAAYNSLFRKIFGYRNFESVTDLQLSLARPTWELLCHSQKDSFYHRLSQCSADSPVHLFSLLWYFIIDVIVCALFVIWNMRFITKLCEINI